MNNLIDKAAKFGCYGKMTREIHNACWRTDLTEFLGLSHSERSGFLVCLEWFENFRLRHSLAADRAAARLFWTDQVQKPGVQREDWQVQRWSEAIRWNLAWLQACELTGKDHRSPVEQAREARGCHPLAL